ncbi:MAG: glycerol-3-phosphate 1-O-acyltransferase PlsY [Candidatus Acetothermia bacterium]|jgi:glycerol-3-phosphate acyltransferase PlsY|nr:glycerol-3-phosphate 1-O-acyltransferase PlsY [Candidatus Acetothermia bacterium]
MTAVPFLMVAALGYLIGGVPTAYLAGRLRGVDIREHGSGNVGGTNAVRVLGWKLGLPVMVVDVVKGYLAGAWLPRLPLPGTPDPVYLALAAGLAAVLGHVFSPYLRFRGGKGVATGAGVLLALTPIPVAICAALFLLLALGSGMVSVGSLGAAAALPLTVFLLGRYAGAAVPPAIQWLTVGLALFVVFTHRTNIRRLLAGRENRFRRPWEPR